MTSSDNKIILNGPLNIKHDLKKLKNFQQNKFQTQFQIQTNHSMKCARLQILASAQHYYNHIVEQIK